MVAEIPPTIGDPSMGEATEKPSDVYDDRLARSMAAWAVESEKSKEHYKGAVEMDLVKEREERELLRKRWLEDEEKRRVEQAIKHRESGRTNAEKEQMNMGGGGQQQKMAASQPANSRKRSYNPGPPDMFPGGPADWRQDIQMMGGLANGNMPPQGYGSQAAMQNGGYPPNVAQNGMQRVPQQHPMQCVPMPSTSQSHAPFHGHMMYNNGAGGPVPGPVGPTNPMAGGPGPGGIGHMNPMGPGAYQQQVPDPSPGYPSCSHMGPTGFPPMGNGAETSVRTPPTGTTPLQQSQQNTPSRATPAQQAPTPPALGLVIDRKVVDDLESSPIVDLDDKVRNFLPSVSGELAILDDLQDFFDQPSTSTDINITPSLPGRESLTTPTSTGMLSPHGPHSAGYQGVPPDPRSSTQDNGMAQQQHHPTPCSSSSPHASSASLPCPSNSMPSAVSNHGANATITSYPLGPPLCTSTPNGNAVSQQQQQQQQFGGGGFRQAAAAYPPGYHPAMTMQQQQQYMVQQQHQQQQRYMQEQQMMKQQQQRNAAMYGHQFAGMNAQQQQQYFMQQQQMHRMQQARYQSMMSASNPGMMPSAMAPQPSGSGMMMGQPMMANGHPMPVYGQGVDAQYYPSF